MNHEEARKLYISISMPSISILFVAVTVRTFLCLCQTIHLCAIAYPVKSLPFHCFAIRLIAIAQLG